MSGRRLERLESTVVYGQTAQLAQMHVSDGTEIVVVTEPADGSPASGDTAAGIFTANGDEVIFTSAATNLVPETSMSSYGRRLYARTLLDLAASPTTTSTTSTSTTTSATSTPTATMPSGILRISGGAMHPVPAARLQVDGREDDMDDGWG